jgi:carbamoyltransferase
LGTSFKSAEIREYLLAERAVFSEFEEDQLVSEAAQLLAQGAIVGWFQGRMEFGPRALGNRSILADSRGEGTDDYVNRQIKFRESYRPFAPAILEEEKIEYFQLDEPSPYMLIVAQVHQDKQAVIPAVTHVDGSARVQTVDSQTNPMFHKLLTAFKVLTGCPVLLNTSFNVRGEPIVESPAQAYRCFMRTGMDALVMNGFLLRKEDQPSGL